MTTGDQEASYPAGPFFPGRLLTCTPTGQEPGGQGWVSLTSCPHTCTLQGLPGRAGARQGDVLCGEKGCLGLWGARGSLSYFPTCTVGQPDGQPGHGPDASEQHLQDPQSHGPNFPEGPRDACVTREWGLPQKAWQAWLCPLSHVAPAS